MKRWWCFIGSFLDTRPFDFSECKNRKFDLVGCPLLSGHYSVCLENLLKAFRNRVDSKSNRKRSLDSPEAWMWCKTALIALLNYLTQLLCWWNLMVTLDCYPLWWVLNGGVGWGEGGGSGRRGGCGNRDCYVKSEKIVLKILNSKKKHLNTHTHTHNEIVRKPNFGHVPATISRDYWNVLRRGKRRPFLPTQAWITKGKWES